MTLELIEELARHCIWIAPVGNPFYTDRSPLRGYMVCRRAISNVETHKTRVDYLRVRSKQPEYPWKHPFREHECMFNDFESAMQGALRCLPTGGAPT